MQRWKKYLILSLTSIFLIGGVWLFLSRDSNPFKKAPEIEEDYSKSPGYALLVKKLNNNYYNDTNFVACTHKGFSECTSTFKFNEITLTWSFLDEINALLKRSDSVDFNQCIKTSILSCYMNTTSELLQKTNNYLYCYDFIDIALRNNCLEEYLPKQAILQQDISLCKKLEDPKEEENCATLYNGTLSVSKNDVSLCENISNTAMAEECKDRYYKKLAIDKKDKAYCEKISFSLSREDCQKNFYFELAILSKDINICAQSTDDALKQYCLKRFISESIFPSTKTPAECEKVSTYNSYFTDKKDVENLLKSCKQRFENPAQGTEIKKK